MRTIQEYIDIFDNAYTKKKKEIEKGYMLNGENITDEETVDRINIDAEDYYYSMEYENSVSKDEFIDNVVGHWLWITGGNPKSAYDDYMCGYEYDELSEVELAIANTFLYLNESISDI